MGMTRKEIDEINQELSENLIAYIDFKKHEEIVTKNFMKKNNFKFSTILTAKINVNYSKKNNNLEKEIFESILKTYDAIFEDREQIKIVVFGVLLTSSLTDPKTMEKITGISVKYSLFFC